MRVGTDSDFYHRFYGEVYDGQQAPEPELTMETARESGVAPIWIRDGNRRHDRGACAMRFGLWGRGGIALPGSRVHVLRRALMTMQPY